MRAPAPWSPAERVERREDDAEAEETQELAGVPGTQMEVAGE
jgi:hypothetical protein